MESRTQRHRVVVVPILRNAQGQRLICRMAAHRGVFPGQWGLPGGGVEPGESLAEALRREVREELGLELCSFRPLTFKEGTHEKLFADGHRETITMLFLIYDATAKEGEVVLNDELDACAWVFPRDLKDYNLNDETLDTFRQIGFLEGFPESEE